jgi:two-component system chemotaxis response regulator CheY
VTPRPYPESILVVDDTEFMVKMLDDIFAGAGYRVHAARSGEEALALYDEVLPDLVTLDVVMPGLDGIATLERLRRLDPACRVIMVSAVGQEDRVLAALQRGARNYILKPFEREKVLAAARRVLDEY